MRRRGRELHRAGAGLSAALVVAGAGCNAEDTKGGGPPVDEFRFDTPSYTIDAGKEKRYFCYTLRIGADRDMFVKAIEPIYGRATHHLGVFYTLADEPDGVFDCAELVKPSWIPIYAGGIQSGRLELPDGAAFRLRKGQQIMVQLHLLNATPTPITDKATVIFETLPSAPPLEAGIYGFDNRTIDIPAGATNYQELMSCPDIGKDMDVFAVFGHMHRLGTHLDVSRGQNPGDEMLYAENWNFDDQPIAPKAFHVSKTDTIHVRCYYDNTTSQDVGYGEATASEMCAFVFYYTPFTSLWGCLKSH